jgi:hypothetical protein
MYFSLVSRVTWRYKIKQCYRTLGFTAHISVAYSAFLRTGYKVDLRNYCITTDNNERSDVQTFVEIKSKEIF